MKYLKLFEKYKNNARFNEWFKNSKVVDKNGDPLVVYHGTKRDFDTFAPKSHREDTEGYYFSADPKYANVFMGYDNEEEDLHQSTKRQINGPNIGKISPSIVPVYLSLQNPFIVDDGDGGDDDIIEDIGYWKNIYDSVKNKGYDGVMTSSMEQIFVFDPTQIKSAYGNIGNFSRDSKSIIEKLKL